MEAYVKTVVENGIGTIAFFHPKSNSLPAWVLHDLAQGIKNCGNNEDVKLIVLQSEGEKAFCAGASFEELLEVQDEVQGLRFFGGFAKVINAMRTCGKLVIARIQGKCVGGGVGIAAAADYAIALDTASVKLSELAIGIGPFVIGPVVEKKVGTAAFAAMAIDATNFYSAEWAKQKGLFSNLVNTTGELDAAVNSLAITLAQSSAEAMRELKTILWAGTENWDQLLEERAAISGRLVLSDFTRKALNNFKT